MLLRKSSYQPAYSLYVRILMLAIGVDVGGTKMKAALVDDAGGIKKSLKRPTNVDEAIDEQLTSLIQDVCSWPPDPSSIIGIGMGIAGIIDTKRGVVRHAANLKLRDSRLQASLEQTLSLPVIIENDARAIASGEWHYGAGQGCDDLVCLVIGTGVGVGVVSGGRILSGELGHIILDLTGPPCTCGAWGCFEALAGGWAITRKAKQVIADYPKAGEAILQRAGGSIEAVDTKIVVEAARNGNPLACRLIDEVIEALIAGAASLVNAFNPARLICGGGIIDGMPELVGRIDQGVPWRALTVACEGLQVLQGKLGNDAGVIGAAALAMHKYAT